MSQQGTAASRAMADSHGSASNRSVGCVVLALFAILLWFAWVMLSSTLVVPRERQMDSLTWREVPCLIQTLRVQQHRLRSKRGTSSTTAFSPQVEFEYEIDGQAYTSDRFWLGGTLFTTREEVAVMIAPFQAGAPTVCYVNPKDPKDAILSRELYDKDSLGWTWLVLFGLVGAIGCAVAMWFVFFPCGLRQTGGGWVPASRTEVLWAWVAALAWNGLFTTLFVRACLRGLPWSNLIDLFGYPFLGLLMAVGASLKTWQHRQAPAAVVKPVLLPQTNPGPRRRRRRGSRS